MSRARATALALVNWKGVFYERYLLDRHVTALEGANGAGKTTVMIAAYVVLLPDMSRLRFTNLGESGATGGDKGVWGRLGALARPSYAAMEIELPGGERVVAGVQLQRKAEPTLELAPFLVTGASLGGRLRDLLLVSEGADEMVPDLDELRANVTRAGAQLQVFATAKDYFAALFERGVTPLRMGTDEERNKLNEMLRTSMTGGISRALTTDLRAFLLKEETGLGDALSFMRANLDACHRTRIEVAEARRLERDLIGVYDAGQAMFAAAVLSTRAAAEERAAQVERALAHRDDAARAIGNREAELAEATTRHASVAGRLDLARAAHDEASARHEHAVRAQALVGRILEVEPELAKTTEEATTARVAQELAASTRETRRRERDAAAEECDRAARGLADLQGGLEELHRNVQAYRQAARSLSDAREALADPALDERAAEATLERCRAALGDVDERRAREDRDAESVQVRRAEYEKALASLGAIDGAIDPPRAHEQARAALARLADLEGGHARASELAAERERALDLAGRQAAAVARAAELGLEAPLAQASQHVEARLAAAEADMRAAEEAALADDARGEAARRSRDEASRRTTELEHAAQRWRELGAIVGRLEAALGAPAGTREKLALARARLARDHESARERVAELKRRRDGLLEQAVSLQSPAVAVHPDLLRLRDELDAELLAARFEDLELADAARVQATLGPLLDALVVEDPTAAARKLAGRERELASVWLVGPDASTGTPEVTDDASAALRLPDDCGDLLVHEGFAIRVTRLPELPTLGRRARERRATEARDGAEVLAAQLEEALAALRAVEALSRDADRLLEEGKGLDAGDPAEALAASRNAVATAGTTARACHDSALAARHRAATARALVERLRALLGEAYLLESTDYAARARELSEALARASNAADELRRTAGPRRTLAMLVDALRTAPPGGADAPAQAEARAALDRERTRLFRACQALEEVSRGRRAFGFAGMEATLTAQGAIAPALEEQLRRARQSLGEHEQALRAAEGTWETATAASQRAAAQREAIEAQIARLRAELGASSEGTPGAPELSVAGAQEALARLRVERSALEAQERELATSTALLRERCAQSARALAGAEEALASERRAADPAAEHWRRTSERAESSGLHRDAFVARVAEAYEGRTSGALRAEARSRAEVLIDRLGAAPGGAECIDTVRWAATAETTDSFFEAWVMVRDWIQRRLPAPLGNLPEPLQALDRLRHELETLEERLARQDTDLRGTSEDVARGIDVQLRRASHQVRRLNQHLEGVRFGSITGIRVQMRRVERMEQVLSALREGAAQELLFRPTMPIEEALDEIFRRYGGGRGGGATRVLDYREYAELGVEIRRHERGEWESASPARLSTGEAIGVGAALMMVILTEWERDANLLRAKRTSGSLRFLFLDEANRLSQDNLAVLFDLCQTLDLQLLIAAPEVARADGNTTYRLVRRVDDEGREEVLVSGRRVESSVQD